MSATDSPLTRGLGRFFVVEDEPYFIESQDPGSTRLLLTEDYGPSAVSPAIGTLYALDISLQPDGRTRMLGHTSEVGNGGVTYFALCHCHNPAVRAARTPDPTDTTPHLSRLVGNRRVRRVAAQRHRLGCGRLIAPGALPA
jgi:hypothetical protein